MLFPFYLVQSYLTKDKHKIHETIILGTATVFQLFIVVIASDRKTGFYLHLLPFVLFIKQFLLPVTGPEIAGLFGISVKNNELYRNGLLACFFCIPHLLLLTVLLIYRARKESMLLIIASFLIASVSFLKSVEAERLEWLVFHLVPLGGGRYYFAPNVLLALALLLEPQPLNTAARARQYLRWGTLILVVMICISGTLDYSRSNNYRWFFSGPNWRTEVARWRSGDKDKLRIWPVPWLMHLPSPGKSLGPRKGGGP
jgi:hypothetical protein